MSCPECKSTGWVTLLIHREPCKQGCVPPEWRNELSQELSNEKVPLDKPDQEIPPSTYTYTYTSADTGGLTFSNTLSGGMATWDNTGGSVTITGGCSAGASVGGSITINSKDNPEYWLRGAKAMR